MHEEEAAIRALYARYLAAFHRRNPQELIPFCAVPLTVVADAAVHVLGSADAVVALYTSMLDDLAARDYDHSEMLDMHVECVSERLALLRAVAVRYTQRGAELERLGALYTLRKGEDGWQFVTVLAYPAAPEQRTTTLTR